MFNPVFKHLFVWEFRSLQQSFSKLFWLCLQSIPWILLFLFMSTLDLWLVPPPSLIWITAVASWRVSLLLLFSHSCFLKGPEYFKNKNQIDLAHIFPFKSHFFPCLASNSWIPTPAPLHELFPLHSVPSNKIPFLPLYNHHTSFHLWSLRFGVIFSGKPSGACQFFGCSNRFLLNIVVDIFGKRISIHV